MSPAHEAVAEAIEQAGVVAVIRLDEGSKLRRVVDTLAGAGVTAIEVTLTVPGALELIEGLASTVGRDVVLGAGTVLDASTAARAIDAGARSSSAPSCAGT